MTDHNDPDLARQRSASHDPMDEQQLGARLRAQLARRDRPGPARVVDVAGRSRIVTFPPQRGQKPYRQDPYLQNPTGLPQSQGPQTPHVQAGQPYPGSPGYAYNWGAPAGPGYGYPPGPAGYRPRSKKSKTGIVVAIIIVLTLGLGIGGFFGLKVVLAEGAAGAEEPGRHVIEQNGITYSVISPDGLVRFDTTPDSSIPSELKLELRLAGKLFDGGEIQIGAVTGDLARRTVEDIAAEVEQRYAHYRSQPEGQVSRSATTVAGRPATTVEKSFRYENRLINSLLYFINAQPGTPPLYLSCDWNTLSTSEIGALCEQVAGSLIIEG